jgi:hypothetical protein
MEAESPIADKGRDSDAIVGMARKTKMEPAVACWFKLFGSAPRSGLTKRCQRGL